MRTVKWLALLTALWLPATAAAQGADTRVNTLRVTSTADTAVCIGNAAGASPTACTGGVVAGKGQFGTVELGAGSTDTTLSRASAGVVAVEGANLARVSANETITGAYRFSATIAPTTNDGAALGTSSLGWSDLFVALGAVLNFNSGDVTVTHSSNALAFAGASSGYTFDAPLVTTSTAFRVGNASAVSTGFLGSAGAQIHSSTYASLQMFGNANNPYGSYIYLVKSRGSVGGTTIVQSEDILGDVSFGGYDGTSALRGAYIEGVVDGTPGVSDMPTRITFGVAPGGSPTAVESLRLTSNGDLAVRATKRFYLDGVDATGNSYLVESSADTVDIVAGGNTALRTTASTTTLGTTTLIGASLAEVILGADQSRSELLQVAGSAFVGLSNAAANNYITVRNTSTASSANGTYIDQITSGENNTGDAAFGVTVKSGGASATSWYWGADASASQAWVLSNSSTLGSNNALSIAKSTYAATFSGTVAWGGGSAIASSSNVLQSGGALGTPSSGTLTNATGLPWAGVVKTGSSLADLATRSAGDLSSGTLADARLSANVPLLNAVNTFSAAGNSFAQSVTVLGGEGGTATLNIWADEGDDSDDIWRAWAKTDGTFQLDRNDAVGFNFAPGSLIAGTLTGSFYLQSTATPYSPRLAMGNGSLVASVDEADAVLWRSVFDTAGTYTNNYLLDIPRGVSHSDLVDSVTASTIVFANRHSLMRVTTAGTISYVYNYDAVSDQVPDDGQVLYVMNADTAAITWTHNAGAFAGKVLAPYSANYTQAPGATVMMVYDETSDAWRIVDGNARVAISDVEWTRNAADEWKTSDKVLIQGTNDGPLNIDYTGGSGSNTAIGFFRSGSLQGAISTTGGTTAYNTTSDERLKTNWRSPSYSLNTLMQVQVRDFDWITGGAGTGVSAQALHAVYPWAVTPGDTWQVDYGKLTPLVIVAVQELKAEIDALRAEVQRLKGGK